MRDKSNKLKNKIIWFVVFIISLNLIFISIGCQKKGEITTEETTSAESVSETTTETTLAPETTAAEETPPTTPEYEKNKIRIGGSGIGRYAITNEFSTTNEVRVLQNNMHPHAEEYIKFCIANKIFCIINTDFFIGTWRPSDTELRNFTISLKNQVKDWGGTKDTVRFTVDNESDKWTDFNSYVNYAKVVNDALNEEFDMGAGNFTSSNGDWYQRLASLYSDGWFDVLDIHMQSGFENIGEINKSSDIFKSLFDQYGISRRSCTEASNGFDVIKDYEIIKLLISKAQYMQLEDICISYFDYIPNDVEPDNGLSFWLNGSPRDTKICDDFVNLINSLKP